MASKKEVRRSRVLVGCLMAAAALSGLLAVAQDYRMHRGDAARSGRASIQSGVVVAETVWNNVGRAFLRWWDPAQTAVVVTDNGPSAATAAGGPGPEAFTNAMLVGGANFNRLAGLFHQSSGVVQPYFWAKTVKATSSADPTSGFTAKYTWTLSGLNLTYDYGVDLSVPVGPTNTDPANAPTSSSLLYQQRYWVVEVEAWDPVALANKKTVTIVDTTKGGGFVHLLGPTQDQYYRPISDGATGHVTVVLYNTVPLNSAGQTLDPTAEPGNQLVYADAVATQPKITASGSYTASPVVGKLENVSPATLAVDAFPQRVVHARTDSILVGALNHRFNVGVVTSSVANGETAEITDPQRKNRVWSWPAARPKDNDNADRTRYLLDVGTWLAGPNATDSRNFVRRVVDNLNSSATTTGAGFGSANATTGFIGGDYLLAPVQPAVTSTAKFSAAKFVDGDYFVDVYIPTGFPATDLTIGATYTVHRGALAVATFTLNQSTQRGWQRLGSARFAHSSAAPLTVTVSDAKASGDVGTESVVADAARFVTDADWSARSTPVMVSTQINDGFSTAARDVVVTASETGRLTCLEAHGDPTTGATPTVYWTYPTEVSAGDPNAAVTEDGGGAETPTEFDISSAMVKSVSGTDYLYVGGKNGRVYCLEMTGRGDGSTRRRWTYPDDFRPDAPTTLQVPTTLGRVKGSVVGGMVGATEAVFVVTTSGKILALDASGDAAKKTTSLLWQYPAGATTIGPVSQTPVYDAANNRLFVAAPTLSDPSKGQVYSIDTATGALNWTVTQHGLVDFGDFSTASPLYLPNATSGIGDTLYLTDDTGYIYALDAANGAVRWEADETGRGADSSLSFAYMRTYDGAGILTNAIPTVLVATKDSRLLGFYADGTTNTRGTHYDWNSYTLKANNQTASYAVGGWPNTLAEQKTHIYVGDSAGNLLAFSSVDDTNSAPPLSDGDAPVDVEVSDNDPSAGVMAVFKDRDLYQYYCPDEYNTTYSTVVAAGATQASDFTGLTNFNPDVTVPSATPRDDFELGETVNFMLSGLPGANSLIGGIPMGEYSAYMVTGASESNNLNQRLLPFYEDAGRTFRAYFVQLPLIPGAAGFGPGGQVVTFKFVRTSDGATVTWPVNVSVANPFAIQFAKANALPDNVSSAGYTLDPAAATVQGNNPVGVDSTASNHSGATFVGGPTDRYLKPAFGDPDVQEAGGYLGPDAASAGVALTHGGTGATEMHVFDRTVLSLVFGPERGLSNVRLKSGDLNWQPLTAPGGWAVDNTDPGMQVIADPETDLGVYKPLNTGSTKSAWIYRKFEDYPWSRPNVSRDYPDASRANLALTRTYKGESQNPLAQGADLEPGVFDTAALTTYNSPAGYGAGLAGRELVATPFTVTFRVPRHQPPSTQDYRSRHQLYVDNGSGVSESHSSSRTFALGMTVAADERLDTQTATLDLGSLAAGAGFNALTGEAQAPFILRAEYTGQPGVSDLSPSNPAYASGSNKLFGALSVLNAGNVNMLNVRLAKAFTKTGAVNYRRSADLYSSSSHELAWLDAQYNMFSDLDPLFAIPQLVGATGMPAQKPRPEDPTPTRMSRNPVHRANGNLAVGTGSLVPATSGLETGDIRVGVAIPVGTPAATYQRPVYAFEETTAAAPGSPDAKYPALGPDSRNTAFYEPYVESGTTLKFTVTESRLTNSTRSKTATNMDDLLTSSDQYAWSNRQPTTVRTDAGTLFVAWTSERRDVATGLPDFNPASRLAADYEARDMSRIYLGSFNGGVPLAGALADDQDHSPLSDLNLARPEVTMSGLTVTDSRWFRRTTSFPDPSLNMDTFFGVGAGESISLGTGVEGTRFHSPSFPSSSLANTLASPLAPRAGLTSPFVGFLGDAKKTLPSGDTVPVHQAFVGVADLVGGTVGSYLKLDDDSSTVKSRPSVVQNGTDAIVGYASTAVTGSDIRLAGVSGGARYANKRLGLRTPFEDMGAPTLIHRRATGFATGLIDVLFTAKVRGRATSEAFLARVNPADLTGAAETVRALPFVERTDSLTLDSAAGVFWAPGVQWALDAASVANIRVKWAPSTGGTMVDLIDPADLAGGVSDPDKAVIDRESGEIVADVQRLGGKVYIDTLSGAVRFSGATIPSNAQFEVTYSPRLLRIGSDANGNYRHVSAVFDERLVGIHDSGVVGRADENLLGDLKHTFNESGIPVATSDPVRYDRLWVVSDKSTRRGKGVTRPYLGAWRYGVALPYSVYVSPSDTVAVTVTYGGALTGWTYQVDPVGRQVNFPVDMDGEAVTVAYTAVRPDGTTFAATRTGKVGLILSRSESAVPMESPTNESDTWVGLDPQSADFNPIDPAKRRPPLLWLFWTSTRAGVPDVYFQTVAPRTSQGN